jgi:protein O-mannosyl-transferase
LTGLSPDAPKNLWSCAAKWENSFRVSKIPPPTAQPFRDPSARWPVWGAAALIAVAVLAAYSNSFQVPLLLDDELTIGNNPSIHHLRNLGAVLSPDVFTTASRPLLNLTFALNYAGSGQNVWGYHALNLAVHVAAALVLFGLVRRTLLTADVSERVRAAALPLGALIAAVWALHPLQTESVTYLSQRAESLMGLFYLLTLYGFVRSTTSTRPSLWRTGSILACFCGMATKEVMVTAPVIVLLYDRAFVGKTFRAALSSRRGYYLGLGASWVLLGLVMQGGHLAAQAAGFNAGVSGITYALTELKVVTGYLRLAVWPHPLVFDYGSELIVTRMGQWAPYLPVAVAMAIGVAFAWRRAAVGFLAVAFSVLLSPTSSFVPVAGQPMAESRMYLPLAALVTLVGVSAYAWVGRRALAGFAIAALVLTALTLRRNHDYRSAVGLWEDTVAKQPNSSRAQNNLGNALAKISARVPQALEHYREALRIKPDFADARFNLAMELGKIPGREIEALTHYEEALKIRPDFAEAHCDLANLLVKTPARWNEALAHYERAIQIKPSYADAHYNFANALSQIPARHPEAITHYEAALRTKPTFAEAHYNFANLLVAIPGGLPEALAHYEAAIRIKPSFAEAHSNLAYALSEISGRLNDALAHFDEALRLKPDFADAHNNLAIVLANSGRIEEATKHVELALKIDPEHRNARLNLEKLRTLQK